MLYQFRSGMVVVVVVLLQGSMGTAWAQGEVGSENGGLPGMHVVADSSATPSSMSLKVQMGMLWRFAGTKVREEKKSYLLEADVLLLGNRNPRRQRGLGLRLTGDDDGGRLGLGYVIRSRPRPGSHVHWQASAGLALFGSDNHRTLRLPSAYITAQYGDHRIISFCAALEVVRYRDALMGYDKSWDEWGGSVWDPIIDEEGTEVSWYLGGMLHGWVGAAASFVAIVAVASAMSSP
ncbi:MAG: hypothetical protein ABIK96_09195 [bacterium]